jgi:hypothetical protein
MRITIESTMDEEYSLGTRKVICEIDNDDLLIDEVLESFSGFGIVEKDS